MNKLSSFYNGVEDCSQIEINKTQLQFTLKAKKTGFLNSFNNSIWRGMWGREIRRKSCINQNAACSTCPFLKNCAYGSIFEPTSDMFAESLKNYMFNISPPYIIVPSLNNGTWEKDEMMTLELILLGNYYLKAHYFIESLYQIAQYGVGKDRIRFSIESITQTNHQDEVQILDEQGIHYHRIRPIPVKLENKRLSDSTSKSDLLISLDTPTRLQKQGEVLKEIDVSSFIFACVRRIQILSATYSNRVFSYQKEEIDEMVSQVKLKNTHIVWQDGKRYSSKQKQEMNLGGIIGTFLLSGVTPEIMAIIKFASHFHIGKQTSFGLGKFSVWERGKV